MCESEAGLRAGQATGGSVEGRSVAGAFLAIQAEPGVRHVGPTAQDFYAAFGLGGDDRHIASIDADGVSLAAIKGLQREVRVERRRRHEQDRRIAHLEVRLAALAQKGR